MAAAAQAERVDPRLRRVNPGQAGQVRNGRADRVYKLANPSDMNHGLQIHLDSGWEKINGRKDGDPERVFGGGVDANGLVTWNGQVLIWLDKTEFDAREEEKAVLRNAYERKRNSPGGIDGVTDADGKPAQKTKEK